MTSSVAARRPSAEEVRQKLGGDFTGQFRVTTDPVQPGAPTSFLLKSGEIDDDAKSFFGYRYCHWLAGALHCLTGWELVAFDEERPHGLSFAERAICGGHKPFDEHWWPVHTAVRTPKGTVLDILGEATPERRAEDFWLRDERVRAVPFRNEDMPARVELARPELRGDPLWWCKTTFADPRLTAIVAHFARTVLTQHGYGEHITNGAHLLQSSRPTTPATHPQPTATTTATTSSASTLGGNTMIEQVRQAIAMSTDKAQTIAGMLQQATTEADEIQALLAQVLQGSSSAEAQQVLGIFAQLTEQLTQSSQAIHPAVEALHHYAARL